MLGVMLGAFGAHALRGRLSADHYTVYQTAVQYHFWHALALLGVGLLMSQWPQAAMLRWSAFAMTLGLVLFCGSLYALALTGIRTFGMVTPLGGATWIVAWALLAWAVLRG
jgi:uncharacterized membrane protein YgdD (TMEM256/DUF423 family)